MLLLARKYGMEINNTGDILSNVALCKSLQRRQPPHLTSFIFLLSVRSDFPRSYNTNTLGRPDSLPAVGSWTEHKALDSAEVPSKANEFSLAATD